MFDIPHIDILTFCAWGAACFALGLKAGSIVGNEFRVKVVHWHVGLKKKTTKKT